MARRRKILTEDDRILWKKVTSTVSPLSFGERFFVRTDEPEKAKPVARPDGSGRQKPVQGKRSAGSGQASFTRAAAKAAPPPAKTSPQAIDHKTVRKIARGRLAIDARIDLHGLTQSSANTALRNFLFQARMNDCRLVLVITGKGTAGTGILRHQVPNWLTSGELAGIVSGFQEAHRNHGGSGALYVRLRRLR